MTALGDHAAKRSLGWLNAGIPLLGLLVVGLMWAVLLVGLEADRQRAERVAFDKAQGLTRAFEQYTQRSLQQIDQITKFIALRYADSHAERDLQPLLEQGMLAQPGFLAITVADEQGRVLASTFAGNRGASMADREYFRVHAAGPTSGLHIGQPLLSKINPRWIVPMSRRLETADHRFAGVALVTLDPTYFTQFYDTAEFGEQGVLSLVGLDWTLFARRSGDRLWHGNTAGVKNLKPEVAKAPAGTFTALSETDGVERLLAYKVLDNYPLVVYAGLARHEALAGHAALRQRLVVFFALATLVLGAAFISLHALVHRLRLSQAQVQSARAQLEAGSNAQLDAFLILRAVRDEAGRIVDFVFDYCNDRAIGMIGLPRDQILGQRRSVLFSAGRDPRFFEMFCRVTEMRQPEEATFSVVTPPGAGLWLNHQVVPVGDGVAVTTRDMTEDHRRETELREARAAAQENTERLRAITDNLPALVAYIGADLRYRFANAQFRTLLGVDPAEVIGRPMREVLGEALYAPREASVLRALAGERISFESEGFIAGRIRTLQVSFIPDLAADGRVLGLYALSFDITALKDIERQLSSLARFDTLTGLANRRQFDEVLPQGLARARRSGGALALMFLDIDHFKAINDTHGHGVGDAVLRSCGQRLQQSVRETDTVARLAGDEFVVILENLQDEDEVRGIARKILARFGEPFDATPQGLAVTLSIGIAVHRGGLFEPGALLAEADKALYAAKTAGRNTFRLTQA